MKLEDHPFFRDTAMGEVRALVDKTEVRQFAAGEVIFLEGSESNALWLVLDGSVAFNKRTPDGQERTISYSKEGHFFGEVGIFTGDPRALSAVAATDCTVAQVDRKDLVAFIRLTPGPIEHILGSIINHLHHTTRHYVDEMLQQEKMSLVGTMVNSIIHDFKNPFTMISLGAQLVRSQHKDEKTRKLCENIEAQVARMVNMANEISEFSKGEQQLHLSPVNLADLWKKFEDLNQPYFQREHIRIEVEIESVVMEAEENKLLRVLQNLVSNAIDALDDKTRDGRVEVKIQDLDGQRVQIIVSDNGCGIPEPIRARFFTPFVTYNKRNGTGLGTAIVKSIVEAHGGRITFQTATGEGTRFTIILPKLQPSAHKG